MLRGAALDGVAIVRDRLADDRDAILAGGRAALEESGDGAEQLLFERIDGDERIEVVLARMPLGSAVEAEGAKFPIAWLDERASAPLASATRSGDAADALVRALRGARDATSIDGIVDGIPEFERASALRALLGPLRTTAILEEDADALPLVSLVSAHAREVLLDAGGSPRLDVVAALGLADAEPSGSGRSDAALDRFEDAEIEAFEEAARRAGAEPDDGALAETLLARGIGGERLDAILPTVTLHAGESAPARVDIARATRPVLEALAAREKLPEDFAERVESVRATLEDAERAGTGWLVARRVLSVEEYARIAGRITWRSTAWRCRVVARLAPVLAEGWGAEDSSRSALAADAPPSRALVAFDAIIEIGGSEPRIVFLRDVSLLDTARALAVARVEHRRGTGDAAQRGGDSAFDSEGDAGADAGADSGADSRADSAADAGMDSSMESSMDSSIESGGDGFPSEPRPATLDNPPRPARGRIDPFGRDVGGSSSERRPSSQR
jgi:hypothetical protein